MPGKDYQPIDISDFCNAGVSALPTGPVRDAGLPVAPVIGDCSLRGLPFHIGSRKPKPKKCFIRKGGKDVSSVEIPVKKTARYLIVAHRML